MATTNKKTDSGSDVTGRDRLARNVGASYLGHIVFIVLGFLMPRMIDGHIGQEGLGVWDLAWSFVGYLSLSMIGIGSSVNRYVATHRAASDIVSLNKLVSTVVAIQVSIALSVFAVSMFLAIAIPALYEERLGDFAGDARWVIGLLGASLSVQMAFDAWRGVISGCHRWDYYNAINSGGYAISAVCMLLILSAGGGLPHIAGAYFIVSVFVELLRFRIAKAVCPEISLEFSAINKHDARLATTFGLKTIFLGVPSVVVTQTVNISMVAALGPGSLAILARPISLIHHISTLVNKYSFVLTPMAGSIQEANNKEELASFALTQAKIGWMIAIPPLAFLFVFGDVILRVWMGESYGIWQVSAVLAVGHLLPISQSTVLRVLVGLNGHGHIAKTGVIISFLALTIGLAIATKFEWSIGLAAAVIAGAAGFGAGLNVLVHAIRFLNIGVKSYLLNVGKDALILLASLIIALWIVRTVFQGADFLMLSVGALSTAVVFAVVRHNEVTTILKSVGFLSGDR